jgi:hypothetical protein
MLHQAEVLIERLTNEKFCDWNNDWKLITIFIGVSQTKICLSNFKYPINILEK